jgi:hypothetical protein
MDIVSCCVTQPLDIHHVCFILNISPADFTDEEESSAASRRRCYSFVVVSKKMRNTDGTWSSISDNAPTLLPLPRLCMT